MKSCSAWRRRTGSATQFAAAAVGLMLVAFTPDGSFAQHRDVTGSDWEEIKQVLVLPSVYHSGAVNADSSMEAAQRPVDAGGSATTDGDAAPKTCIVESPDAGSAQGGLVVYGDADTLQNCSTSGPEDAQSTQARADGTQPGAGEVDPSIGSADDYQEQQTIVESAGPGAVVQMPVVVVGPPAVPYYLPQNYAPPASAMSPVYTPARPFPGYRPAWMPPVANGRPAWMPAPAPAIRAPTPMVLRGAPMAGYARLLQMRRMGRIRGR